MKRLVFLIFLLAAVLFCQIDAGVKSLSQVFSLGGGLVDKDGDNLADTVALSIVIPEEPSPIEIALATEIAARTNFESLALHLELVKKESQLGQQNPGETTILLGSRLRLLEKIKAEAKTLLPTLEANQGVVFLFEHSGHRFIAVIAGSETALLKTGRAFFLRWPYLWEIWGNEDGITYHSLETDLLKFWQEEGLTQPQEAAIQFVRYQFPDMTSSSEAIRQLKFDTGEIAELGLECTFSDRKSMEKAWLALKHLQDSHRRGEKSQSLNYPGCRSLRVVLSDGSAREEVTLSRLSYPRRILTPSYKTPAKQPAQEKSFDLVSLFSEKGFYSDGDKDGLLDGVQTLIIVPENLASRFLPSFASRLMLPTVGASFPVVYFDTEIEDIKTIPVPCLLGDNRFTRDLLKTGKLKLPPLERAQASVHVVPKAFNKTDCLVVAAADSEGLDKVLAYLAQTFPYLEDYGEANPTLGDISDDLEKFLRGEGGSAEAFIRNKLQLLTEKIKGKDLEYLVAEVFLPEENQKFTDHIHGFLAKSLKAKKLEVRPFNLKQNKVLLEKEKEFNWEVEDALALLEEKIRTVPPSKRLLVTLTISESPAIRKKVKAQAEDRLRQAGFSSFEVEVGSAYKQGFYWLTEKILPQIKSKPVSQLTIRFAEERDDFSKPKRFYTEPLRWLQELYPVDEILARELGLPLDNIHFEMRSERTPVYEVLAFDDKDHVLLRAEFSPRTREIPFLKLLPDWGTVKITTGWLEIKAENLPPLEELIPTDLERIWDFYQEEILRAVYAHVMKKTANKPTTAKQPYFKRLLVEIWASEPDYQLGLDEEIISSLEAMHDELYFDTLDFLRGITEIEVEDEESPEDTSRLSAPGNILPVIHSSREGEKARVKVVLEDWPAPSPRLILKWKETGREQENSEEVVFTPFKPKAIRYPGFIYDGKQEIIENLIAELEFEKEADYLACLETIQQAKELGEQNLVFPAFSFPRLRFLTLRLRHKDLIKEEMFTISVKSREKKRLLDVESGQVRVNTEEIISPERCLEIVRHLSGYPPLRTYIGGVSYEKREVPVIEAYLPHAKYVSLARLLIFKPTLFLSGRQHANEVSSTNYLLKLAELLATDPVSRESLKKINFVLLPLENPDGASLAFELQKLTPFHSLHAGRYSSLGVDIGYQVGLARPFLPEARVRKRLFERWLPDIYLNLHGYPSHEWVQPFSGYSPYLFRDYWIPRGWFAYFRAPRLSIYENYSQAAKDLRRFLIAEMQADEKIRESNAKFYARYHRWAGRWQPHLNELELYEGLNLYVARRTPQEIKLTPRTRITYVEETPELMDETARGAWLDFLCRQGLAYLQAHVKYLSQVKFEIGRIDEEIQDRMTFQFVRTRPGRPIKPD